jgi:hypothetical protein
MDYFRIAGMAIGLVVILSAAASAFKTTLSINHVITFAIGAVLAGLPAIHLGDGSGLSVDIGDLKAAAVQNTKASASQIDSLTQINDRIDKLSALVGALSETQANLAAAGPVAGSPPPAPLPAANAEVLKNWRLQIEDVNKSGALARSNLAASRNLNFSASQKLGIPAAALKPVGAAPSE